MAISQVSKGVYVISPNQVKKYKDSAAGEYTSVFTKERAEQWQMAQKQALLELELGTKQFAEEMKTYRDRLDALDARRKELESLKVRVAEGRLDAADASAIAAMREAGDRQKTAADFAAKKAAVAPVTTGTTTTGGGGRRGAGPDKISADAQKEIDLSKAQVDPANAVGLVGNVETKISGGRIGAGKPEEADAARYRVVNESIDANTAALMSANPSMPYEDARDIAQSQVLGNLRSGGQSAAASAFERIDAAVETDIGTPAVTERKVEYYRKYPGLGPLPEAPVVAAPSVAGAEGITGPEGLIAGGIAAIEAERAKLARPTMAGFDYITRAREVAAGRFGPTPASSAFGQRNALDALLRADPSMRTAIMESFSRASAAAPQGVTGPTATGATGATAAMAPAAPAPAPTTERGWESVGVLKPNTGDAAADAAAYQAAKDAWSASQAQAAAGPAFTMPPAEEIAIAPGQSAESLLAEAVDVGASARTPGLTPGGQSALQRLADTKFAEAERRMAEESRIGAEIAAAERPFQIPFEERGGETVPFFRKPGGLADQRAMEEYARSRGTAVPAAAPPSPAPVTPQAPVQSAAATTAITAPAVPEIRPEAAVLMTDAEREDFKRRLQEAADQRALMAEIRGPSEAFRSATFERMTPPSELPAPVRPQMTPPAGVVGSLGDIRVPSGAVAPSTISIGRYTPGPGPAPVTMVGPSTADAAPRSAAAAPEGFFDRPSRPLTANMAAKTAIREGEESAEATDAAKRTMADIKASGTVEAFRGPKTGPGQTKEGYLLNRLEGAYALAKKADKLSRISASGPGKVAYDLYVANRAKGIPFSRTYEEITMTFSGDMSAMEKAHETALALDIKDRDTAPGGK
jgi:hypothetical protein